MLGNRERGSYLLAQALTTFTRSLCPDPCKTDLGYQHVLHIAYGAQMPRSKAKNPALGGRHHISAGEDHM